MGYFEFSTVYFSQKEVFYEINQRWRKDQKCFGRILGPCGLERSEYKLMLARSLPPRTFKKVFVYADYYLHYRRQTISKWIFKLKWHGVYGELLHTWLLCMHKFWTNTYIFIYVQDLSHISVLPIKRLINQDGEPTIRHKLSTGMKPSVANLRVLFVHVLYERWLHMLT